MKTYFVRHGQSEYNVGLTDKFNSNVTPKGIEQATRAAMTLRDEITDPETYQGYTSPYVRCLQTARILQQRTGIKFKVVQEIGETPEEVHRNVSALVYRLEDLYPEFDWRHFPKASYDYGNESDQAYLDRLNAFLKTLAGETRNTLVCSHMTPTIHMIRAICFNSGDEPLTINNCSITLIEDKKPIYIGKVP